MSRGSCVPVLAIGLAVCMACSDRASDVPVAQRGSETTSQPAIHVTGRGSDQANDICSDFQMNDDQAAKFFAKATTITAQQLHDEYEYLPCWVEGTMIAGSEQMTWRIRAGASAEVHHPDNTTELRGCKTCDELFGR